MKQWWIIPIICSFFAGSMIHGTSIFAASEDKGNPFDNLQKQIDDIIKGNTSIEGESKIFFLGNGFAGSNNPVSFACGGMFIKEPLTSCTRTIPLDGIATDLTATSMNSGSIISPGIGKSYEVTLVQNGFETELSCVITGEETSCQNTSHSVTIFAGDLIDLKITSIGNPNFANIAGSMLVKP